MASSHLKLVSSSSAAVSTARSRIPLLEDRAALVLGLARRDERAAAAFFKEFSPLVERTIGRIIGFGDDLPDATQEAFLRAMRALERLRDPQALVDWLLQIAVRTAVDVLRRRKRRRWLLFFETEQLEEPLALSSDESGREALRATYRVLDRLSADERTVFALRFIDGMDIESLANAHDCSRSTVKRRLARATARFQALARSEHALMPWLEGSRVSRDEEDES